MADQANNADNEKKRSMMNIVNRNMLEQKMINFVFESQDIHIQKLLYHAERIMLSQSDLGTGNFQFRHNL